MRRTASRDAALFYFLLSAMHAFHWNALLTPEFLGLLLRGMALTCALALLSSLFALAAGVLLAMGRCSQGRALRLLSSGCCHAVRSVPGVFWLIFLFFGLPMLVPQEAGRALNGWEAFPFWAAVAGLSIGGFPYFADIFFSVAEEGRDSLAAARLSGLKTRDIWLSIVLPSAFLSGFPALSLRLLHQLKNTSLAMVISVPELTWASQEIESLSFAGLEATTAATALYLLLGCAASLLLARAEKKLQGSFASGAGHASCL